jgi:hypothetical protein
MAVTKAAGPGNRRAKTGGADMSLGDKIKTLLGKHGDKVDEAIEKVGDMADRKTGGKYAERIDQVQRQAKKAVDEAGRPHGGPPEGGTAGPHA